MKENAYMLGFICGLVIVFAVCIVLRIVNRKKKACEYDERQEAIRGTGFKYAYFTALIVMVLGGIVETMTGVSWCNLFTFALLALWVSICVFTTYCVVKDAYFTLRSKRGLLMVIFLAAGVINLCIGIDSIVRGEILEGGALSLNASNLITGAACAYLFLMMLGYAIYERRRGDSE